MTVATERNGHHYFSFITTRQYGAELCMMLAQQNIALYNDEEYTGDFCLTRDAVRSLTFRGFIESRYVEPNPDITYFLTTSGILMALQVFEDREVKQKVQLWQHEYVVHPDTMRLRMLQEQICDRRKTAAAIKTKRRKPNG